MGDTDDSGVRHAALWAAGQFLREALQDQGLLEDEEELYVEDEDTTWGIENTHFPPLEVTVDLEITPPERVIDYYRLYLNHMDHLVTHGVLQRLTREDEPTFASQRDRFVTLLLHTQVGSQMLWVFYGVRNNWLELMEQVMMSERDMPSG